MNLRPYQEEFVEACIRAFGEHRRILGVAATGAGKTIMASELMAREPGRCLFLADARELITQNADKFFRHTGERAGVEMGNYHARLSDRVVVATSQTIHRRLDKYPSDHFSLVIVDEAHRNTLGGMSSDILAHFSNSDRPARILGMTATPFRSDRKQLGDFYETIAVEISLDRLIREGYLARIHIKSAPLKIDLSRVRSMGGDYRADDLDEALDPYLFEAAAMLRDNMKDRRAAVTFLPLVKTSKRFAEICNSIGLPAVHVDGQEREALELFVSGKARVICNSALLTTGWDCPFVDLVFVLRPTKSLALYMQMVGRGTRICEGKANLLLLDPLYLTEDHRLIKPARLIARTVEEAAEIEAAILQAEGGEDGAGEGIADLLAAERDAQAIREANLKRRMEEKAAKKARSIDALEFALSMGNEELQEYEPETSWESAPMTKGQRDTLEKFGFDLESVTSRGQASRILDLLFLRRERGLATPKQVRLLKRLGHPRPAEATFEEASAFLDEKLRGAHKPAAFSAREMVALRKLGHNPLKLSREEGEAILAGAAA